MVTRARRSDLLDRLVVLCTILAMALSLTSCRHGRRFIHRRRHVQSPAAIAHARSVAGGRVAYQRYCALCHGANAQGYAADHANAIGNPDFLSIATDAFLRSSINNGRPGTAMSAWGVNHGGPLAEPVVDDIIAYLRTYARKPAVVLSDARIPGDAERARPVWVARCQTCHGERAEGSNVATGLSSPFFQRAASDAFIEYTIEHGRAGTRMAAYGALGFQTLNDLVALVRTFNRAPNLPVNWVGEPPPGLDHLVINPTGPMPDFTLTGDRYVSCAAVAGALASHQRMVILDARAASDWGRSHIPGALPYPFYDIEAMAAGLPHDGTWILAYCACPHAASGHVVDELRHRGFEHTAVIDEGIQFWTAHGYPTAGTGATPGALPTGPKPQVPMQPSTAPAH